MTLRLSTGLRNALNAQKAVVMNQLTDTSISFNADGGGAGGLDQILDSNNGLIGFSEYDNIQITGSTSNNVEKVMLSVAAGEILVAAGDMTLTEVAGDQVVLASSRGGSFADLFRHGVMRIYSGTQPTTADLVESGSLLAVISESSGAFTKDLDPNGINFDTSTAGVLGKRSDETWSGVGLLAATAGWFRFYDNGYTPGESTTEIRFDGAIATSGGELNMGNTSITLGGTTTIDTVAITLPAA